MKNNIRFYEERPDLRLILKPDTSLAFPGNYAVLFTIQKYQKKWYGGKWHDVQERKIVLMADPGKCNNLDLVHIDKFNLDEQIAKFWAIYFDREKKAMKYAQDVIPIFGKL